MDLSRQEFNTDMRSGPLGWHSGNSDPRVFHSRPRDNAPSFERSDGGPRMRGAMDGKGLLRNPNYIPGFDNSHMSPPDLENGYRDAPGFDNNHRNRSRFDNSHRRRSGFDNSHNFHSEMMFQESLEITSDRPFLPQRRAPPGGPNVTSSSVQIPRGDNQGVKAELCGPSQSRLPSVAVNGCNAQEASEGGPSELLHNEKAKKRKKPGAEDAQPDQRSSTAANNYERATKFCHKLWIDLDCAIQQRERNLREKEYSFTPSTINKEVLEEEKIQTAAMKNEIMEERRRLEEEAERIRKEKDALERTSTDLAVQMVELKQVQRHLEKEKAALLARKAKLSAKERCSQERDCVNATVDTPLVAVKAETVKPVTNPCNNCGKSTNCTTKPGATPSNIQNQEPKTAIEVFPVASNKNLKSVKAEPVTSESSKQACQ